MSINNYWALPTDEQQKQINAQTPAQVPGRSTLQNALSAGEDGMEYAVCASGLFIIVVQDQFDIGGGYGVHVTALGNTLDKHFDTMEELELWLAINTPAIAHSPIWIPLPVFHCNGNEVDLIKKLWKPSNSLDLDPELNNALDSLQREMGMHTLEDFKD